MDFHDLVDRNLQAQDEDRIKETTTIGDISFIPAQVGKVRSEILKLKKKKNRWNLEILESDECRGVRFENELQINVPNEHWESFQSIFDTELTENSYLDLQLQLQDRVQMEEKGVFETRKEELKHKIKEQLNSKGIRSAAKIVNRFLESFDCKEDLTPFMEKIVIPLNRTEQWTEDCYSQILEEHEEDLGYLEILLENWDGESRDYLAGGRYLLNYKGIGMILETKVNPDSEPSCSLKINDDLVADDLDEAFVGLPRIGNVFYPIAEQADDIICMLKEIIENRGE